MHRELRPWGNGYAGSYTLWVDGEKTTEHFQLNKKEFRAKKSELDALNAADQKPVATSVAAPTGGKRYLALAARAEGLNTGKAWVADWRTIDKGHPPEWEGQLVCYVYPK